ncbi:unnamed protein product [Scytosiphon promiscuus]
MEDEGQAKQGISREGPLRSIASPPFARPLAHNNDGAAAVPGLANSSGPTGATPLNVGGAISTQPLGHPSRAHQHQLQDSYNQQQQEQQQQQQQQSSDPFGGARNSLSAPPASETPPFPASDSGAASPDPLSHLLLRPGGMRMERDAPHALPGPAAAADSPPATKFDFSGKPPAVARTMPPPSTAEPVGTGGEGWGVGPAPGASRVERVTTSGSTQAPSTPTLPPPPPTYDGPQYYQQQQQQRAPGPSPPVVPSGGALPLPPPQTQQHRHQQRAVAPPAAAAAASAAAHVVPRPQEKSLDALVAEFLTSEAPPPPEPVSETLALGDPHGWLASLGQLARRRAWRKLVDIAGTMLVAHRGGGAPGLTAEQAMDLRLRRVMGMLKLGNAAEAAEAAAEAGKEAGQPPLAAVSVAARVATAAAKSLCEGEAEEQAVDELTALKFELERVISADESSSVSTPSPSSATDDDADAVPATTATKPMAGGATLTAAEAIVWRRRAISSLVNTFVGRGNWRLALGLLDTLGEEQCGTRASAADCSSPLHHSAAASSEAAVGVLRVELLSRIGRVFLQFGSLKDAEIYFPPALTSGCMGVWSALIHRLLPCNQQILVNRGLLDFSRNEFVAAQENFRKAAAAAATAAEEEPPDDSDDGWLWATLDQGAGLLESALNNLSLAMVYSCDVMPGVKTLEGLIRKDPRLYMLDVVIFNLCTLYDLSYDAVASAKKKRTLQAVAQRFRLEDIDVSSFRMS